MRSKFIAAAVGAAMLSLSFVAAPASAAVVSLDPSPCDIYVTLKCHFEGNITLANLDEVDDAYNAQTPTPTPLLNLAGLAFGDEFSNEPEDEDLKSGHIDADFLVEFYAVKAGSQFFLYKLAAPSASFDWNTNDLIVGSGNAPALSHLVWLGSQELPCTGCGQGIPEPATWGLMIMGFMGSGAMLRRRRYELA